MLCRRALLWMNIHFLKLFRGDEMFMISLAIYDLMARFCMWNTGTKLRRFDWAPAEDAIREVGTRNSQLRRILEKENVLYANILTTRIGIQQRVPQKRRLQIKRKLPNITNHTVYVMYGTCMMHRRAQYWNEKQNFFSTSHEIIIIFNFISRLIKKHE